MAIVFWLRPRFRPFAEEYRVQAAVARTSVLTGIAASAAEDIDRWGMITLLDYRRTSRSFRRFESLDLRLLDPVHWSIGKLTRFLQTDVLDVVAVFRSQEVDAYRAARIWGKALRASPRSTTRILFRKQVEDFLSTFGRRIWGRDFDEAAALKAFGGAAKISEPT